MAVKATVMPADVIARSISRISYEITEKNDVNNVAILGIHTRGVAIGRRIAARIKQVSGADVPFGVLDIVKFRDDREHRAASDNDLTDITFSLKDKDLILVDDVLFTGRTVRAALNATIALGRPKTIQLAVLVDRGHRELPIKADYVGKNLPTALADEVQVQLTETDGTDCVLLLGV